MSPRKEKETLLNPPLKLTPGTEGVFLETRYWKEGNKLKYGLKNDNADGTTKIWRYHHYDDNTPYLQKRATITACLRKIERMSSDNNTLQSSAATKIAEFRRLRYPITALRRICSYLPGGDDGREIADGYSGRTYFGETTSELSEQNGPKAGRILS